MFNDSISREIHLPLNAMIAVIQEPHSDILPPIELMSIRNPVYLNII